MDRWDPDDTQDAPTTREHANAAREVAPRREQLEGMVANGGGEGEAANGGTAARVVEESDRMIPLEAVQKVRESKGRHGERTSA